MKALCDVICTSGNAVKIVEAAPKDRDLLFVPDENLGAWVQEQTGWRMTLRRAICHAHVEFRRDGLLCIGQLPELRSWCTLKASAKCVTLLMRFARQKK